LSKALKVVTFLLAVLLALNFGYVQAQQPYAETLDEIISRLPSSWHGFDELSKHLNGQSLNGIWGKQEGTKYKYFQIGIWQFESEDELEISRESYEAGTTILDSAAGIADDILGNARTSTSTIAGGTVFTLTASSSQLQVDQLSMSSGIYHDYGIFVWAFDAPVTSSAIWAELADLIGGEAEEPPPAEPEPEPEGEQPPASSAGLDRLVSKIDEAEQSTLAAVLTHQESFLNTAVESKIQLGFLVGRLLEKHDVDLELLKTVLSADLYEKLDYAYDLDKIDSLRSYCQANDYDSFSAGYEQYATQKVRAEFSFDEAERRIEEGFAQLEAKAEDGEFGGDVDALEAVLGDGEDSYIASIDREMWLHDKAMYEAQKAAKSIDDTIGIMDKLTSLCDKLFGSELDNAKLASELSLVWAQNEVRYWTTTVYLWGGTDKLTESKLVQLGQQYKLLDVEESYQGAVFAAEEGLEEVLGGE
jgi:hypothetical protein